MTEQALRKPVGWFATVFIGLSLLSVISVIALRTTAAETDYAVVNAATVVLSFLAWVFLTLGLSKSSLPSIIWTLVGVVPILAVASFFAFNRIKRFSGELMPQFESRWGGEAELKTVAVDEPAAQLARLLEPNATDFSQFRGQFRDGVVHGVQIDSAWAKNEPEVVFKQAIGSGWSGFAVQGGVAVTMEQRDDEEWVSAYNLTTGELLWHHAMVGVHKHVMGGVGPRSTPTIWQDRVYAVSAVSDLVCLELATGEVVWDVGLLDGPQAEFEELVTWGRSGSAIIDDGRIIVPVGGIGNGIASLIAFDANSGAELMRFGDFQISYSSPVVATLDGVRQLIYTSEENLSGFSLDSGEMLWTVPAPGASSGQANVAQPIVVNSNQVLITKGYGLGGRLWQVEKDDAGIWQAEKIWEKSAVLKTKFTSAVVFGAYAYALSDGILECVEIATGNRMWKRGRYRQGQVLLVGQHLVVTSEGGEVVLVEATPERFRELRRKQVLGDVSWNTAALVGDLLLMRNSDEMACVRLPATVSELNESQATQIQGESL